MATEPTLRRGSTGEAVSQLQRHLAAVGFDPRGIDLQFGFRTEAAVRMLQAVRGLSVDGIVGPKTRAALRATGIGPITVRQPQPFDIVGDPVSVCGIGTGFEATFNARVRDANGQELADTFITAGTGSGGLGNFHVEIDIPGVPPTPSGRVEVFEFSATGEGEINKVTVPIVFGTALIEPYAGFNEYKVAAGDTLREIAQQFYGDPNLFTRILEANRFQLTDPNQISTGQILRVPQ